ncbi:hypothetical protein T03_515, partial [Trichinella britovi]
LRLPTSLQCRDHFQAFTSKTVTFIFAKQFCGKMQNRYIHEIATTKAVPAAFSPLHEFCKSSRNKWITLNMLLLWNVHTVNISTNICFDVWHFVMNQTAAFTVEYDFSMRTMEQVFSAVAYQISEQGARTDMLANKLESRKTRLSFMVRK